MELHEAEEVVTNLMHRHDLIANGWKFKFDNAQKRLGLCNHTTKTISVSRYMANAATKSEIEQIALHEIAHALISSREGHGALWKSTAKSIGFTGSRLAINPYASPKTRNKIVARNQGIAAAKNAGITAGVGDKLLLKNGEIVTIVRKARTRWHAVTDNGKGWTIPASLAASMKLAALNAA